MSAITLTILIILTLLIFGLTFVALHSILKLSRKTIEAGELDDEILESKKASKKSKILIGFNYTFSGLCVLFLIISIAFGIIFKTNDTGVNFGNNTPTILVIASDSMDGFYTESYGANILEKDIKAKEKQFKVGDILKFNPIEDKLIPYDVYGYKNNKGKIIVHRLIDVKNDQYIFRGDNTPGNDMPVEKEQIIYHYTGQKVEYIGNFILFSKSLFGLYSLLSVLIIYGAAEFYLTRYSTLIKQRKNIIMNTNGDLLE